jgi:ferredoxin
MKSIAIICHSGTGGTRTITNLLARRLAGIGTVTRLETDDGPAQDGLRRYDLLVFGCPTFYLKPTPSMMDYIEALPRYPSAKPAFIFTTMAWYAENSLRRLGTALRRKNIYIFGFMEFTCPASDGSLTIPAAMVPSVYRFGRKTASKIAFVARAVDGYFTKKKIRYRLPPLKWYSFLAQVLQIALFNRFDRFRYRLRVYRTRCTDCGLCVLGCPQRSWLREGDEYRHLPDNCELCLRCVHHCPQNAIGWNKRMLDKKKLTPSFYREWEEKLKKQLRV